MAAIPGWIDRPTVWRIPQRGVARGVSDIALAALAALLVFGGLMSLALGVPEKRS